KNGLKGLTTQLLTNTKIYKEYIKAIFFTGRKSGKRVAFLMKRVPKNIAHIRKKCTKSSEKV
ncbi:MAG: hypothetical protein LUC90_00005, partial [Lachnospiraceae bacterium]|nr:hypothetical protein [Lachnospiraceae bacterium]